ncbi:receptor-like serine/threonine-protein kinase ALE2 isoform X1 [Cannabis sativa]|uniref:receptor-like serine/threonine-protein kinase ALE2 isoform X1 n=1 Tax=Cannabis sativa TaxID=3483 RepID=UPI0029CA9D94|nr:receptor-like serine/threonine-protein kinase ALE2 isoform X1 [Cannabis sativa]
MGVKIILLLMEICLAANALHFRGSEDSPSLRRWVLEPSLIHHISPSPQSSKVPDHASSPTSSLSFGQKPHAKMVALPSKKAFHHKWLPAKAADPDDATRSPSIAIPPSMSSSRAPAKKWAHGPVSSPSVIYNNHHHKRRKFNNSVTKPTHPTYTKQGPSVSHFPSSRIWPSTAPAPSESPRSSSSHYNMPIFPPTISPLGSSLKKIKAPPPSPPLLALPPPPPNTDCSSVTCTEPLTYMPTGSPCGCVLPIQVKLRLGIAIYTFFSSVSELAEEIAASVNLNHSQVRIMGADAASQQLVKTVVLVNLVPKGVKFGYTTAFSIYEKFWRRQVLINESRFGSYEVLYVHYTDLPPSPPSAPLSISAIDDGPYTGHDNHGKQILKPLGVDVSRRKHNGLSKSMIAVIIVSSFTAFVVCLAVVWFLLLKFGSHTHKQQDAQPALISSLEKQTGAAVGSTRLGSMRGSESLSISSGTMTYAGTAKIFSLNEMERATNSFDASRILGEGGFGLVYNGTLDDGRKVAVKVLKRDNHHGGQEFLAEVEMLSRLHHRNLVKLIGICTEDQTRCLVYELVPNGSVESHLHGVDKESDPLDWDARMKIALGAARGLAYLHEDSNPRVIHRDFKSSNILLEHDFTPKVSDFGLARAALEGNRHISTHVMGTFGYLAPEYAMTGHLLVKSDVYSYGVVLLELLTGRKPVDLSQPPGQENLVAWARPLLTSKEGLETIIDPGIQSEMISLDSVSKVAAIASMCVQPEVSHRPFMGEVVQALKLVCNECEEAKGLSSRCHSQNDFLADHADSRARRVSHEIAGVSQSHRSFFISVSSRDIDNKVPLSTSELFSGASVGVEQGEEFGSLRKYSSNSGPLRIGRRKQFWQRLKSLSRGSASEHGFSLKLWPGSS